MTYLNLEKIKDLDRIHDRLLKEVHSNVTTVQYDRPYGVCQLTIEINTIQKGMLSFAFQHLSKSQLMVTARGNHSSISHIIQSLETYMIKYMRDTVKRLGVNEW